MSTSYNDLKRICHLDFPEWDEQPWVFLQIRKVSIYLTWLLIRTPLSANGVTVLGILTGILASVLAGVGLWPASLILLLLTVVLDFCDGEVSRFRGQQSKEGSYLDKIYHFTVHPCVFAGVAIGAHRLSPSDGILLAGFTTVIGVSLYPIAMTYARELAVWKHYQRFLSTRLPSGARADPEDHTLASQRHESYSTSKPGTIRRVARAVAAWWNFPHVLIVLSGGLLFQIGSDSVLEVGDIASPIVVLVYSYALTYPLIISFAIIKTMRTRAIEQDFQQVVERFTE